MISDKNILLRLQNESLDDQYTEHIRKYNGTGDGVVVTTLHPCDQLFHYHDHDFFEMVYIIKGECLNMIEGQPLTMKAGDLILQHPDTLHTLYSGSDCRVINFLLSIPWAEKTFEHLRQKSDSPSSPALTFFESAMDPKACRYVFFPQSAVLDKTAEALCMTFALPAQAVRREALMTLLLCDAMDHSGAVLSPTRFSGSAVFRQMLAYTVRNDSTVSLDVLSRRFGYTKTYICRLFREATGESFNDRLIALRLQKACLLLTETDLPAEEIAHRIGYESVEYFHRLFHRKFGLTPIAYRRAHAHK